MENKLRLACLVFSIIGVFFLLILSATFQPKQVSSYQELKLGEYVKTQGKVIYAKNYDDFSILTLSNNLTLTCNCRSKVNATIQVQGKVTEYKGKLQVQSNEIKEIKNVI